MRECASFRFMLGVLVLICLGVTFDERSAFADEISSIIKSIVIRAPRDMGYFAGDLVEAYIDLIVAADTIIETSSLPHPGPVNYWLDIRHIDVSEHAEGTDKSYRLKIVYQDFYDALDARPQEIPAFSVLLRKGEATFSADIPAWTIGVSPLREIAPPPKDDPKEYMRADQSVPLVRGAWFWQAAALSASAAILALIFLGYDRAWWPFHNRPARPFGAALRQLRNLREGQNTQEDYMKALLILHRCVDQTYGRRVLADDVPNFLQRHPAFVPLNEGIARFFAASRLAFFRSDPARSRVDFPFDAMEILARQMAAAERRQP